MVDASNSEEESKRSGGMGAAAQSAAAGVKTFASKTGRAATSGAKKAGEKVKHVAKAAGAGAKTVASKAKAAASKSPKLSAASDEQKGPEDHRPTTVVEAEKNALEEPSVLSMSGVPENEPVVPNEPSTRKVAEVDPWTAFATSDVTLFLILSIAVAAYPSTVHWGEIRSNKIPWIAASSWVLVAFMAGQVLSHIPKFYPPSDSSERESDSNLPEECHYETPEGTDISDSDSFSPTTTHRLFSRFRPVVRRRRKARPFPIAPRQPRSGLNPKHRIFPWQRDIDPTLDKSTHSLMKQLLRSSLRRKGKSGQVPVDELAMAPRESVASRGSELGQFDLSNAAADSLEDVVIDPLFTLRGMDVFLTDQPEECASTHPWLIQQGLRTVPSFVVNVVTAWGNIFIYFEMPAWADNFEDEKESDADDVKALKRFLSGNDDYRNKRLKMIPAVVEAPTVVKMLAPAKKEFVVHKEGFLPLVWKKLPSENGLSSAIEVQLDCLGSRAIRGMAGIVKKHLHKLVIDAAVTIGAPVDSKTDEPLACLGLWRFNHIDITMAPALPDRFETDAALAGETSDVMRVQSITMQGQ